MTARAVEMKPCPSWCADQPDHDAEHVARGDDGRVHRTERVGDQYACWDDHPGDADHAWEFEPHECFIWGATSKAMANEMRRYAAEIIALADLIEPLSV